MKKKLLIEQLEIKNSTVFDGEFLYLNDEIICLNCHDSSECTIRKIIRLIRNYPDESESYICVHCKTEYKSIGAQKRCRDQIRNLRFR